MAEKKVAAMVKLQLPAGKATPGPPVGSSLGPHGINIAGFTKEFNEKTASQAGLIIPVVITIYADRSFTFVLKTPPAAVLIKKAIGLEKGSAAPNKTKVGKITREQIKQIAHLSTGAPSSMILSYLANQDMFEELFSFCKKDIVFRYTGYFGCCRNSEFWAVPYGSPDFSLQN